MKVKFIKAHENAGIGDIADVSDVVGKGLLALNIAEEVKEEQKIMVELDEKKLGTVIHDEFVKFQKENAPKVGEVAKKKSFGQHLLEVAQNKTVNVTTGSQGAYATTYQTITDAWDIIGTGTLGAYLGKLAFTGTDNQVKVNLLTSVGTAPAIVAEDSASTPSQPVLSQIPIVMKKLMYSYVISNEALQDTGMLQQLINEAVQYEFSKFIEQKTLTGTYATDGFEGIIGATYTYSVDKESGQTAGTILKENIFKMYNSLKNVSGSVWVMSRTALSAVQTLTSTANGYPLFQANYALSPNGTLLGLPIVVSDFCPALGTVGDIICGNFGRGYKMVMKGGLTTAFTDDLYFLYDQRCYRMSYRMGGRIVSTKLQAAGDSSYVADFVTLATRS